MLKRVHVCGRVRARARASVRVSVRTGVTPSPSAFHACLSPSILSSSRGMHSLPRRLTEETQTAP